MRSIFQILLIIAVTVASVTGPYLTFEVEHSHELGHHHDHQHPEDDHHHHPHDQGSIPPSEAPEGDEPEDDSHSHTHIVSLGADAPFAPHCHTAFMVNRICVCHPAAISEFVPDGPCFPLIKPPQLG